MNTVINSHVKTGYEMNILINPHLNTGYERGIVTTTYENWLWDERSKDIGVIKRKNNVRKWLGMAEELRHCKSYLEGGGVEVVDWQGSILLTIC